MSYLTLYGKDFGLLIVNLLSKYPHKLIQSTTNNLREAVIPAVVEYFQGIICYSFIDIHIFVTLLLRFRVCGRGFNVGDRLANLMEYYGVFHSAEEWGLCMLTAWFECAIADS